MNEDVVQQLLALNRVFYRDFADYFARSRAYPWVGFERLAAALPQPCPRFLDVGCGDGRLGRFLHEQEKIEQYTGADFSTELMAAGESHTNGEFVEINLIEPHSLRALGRFEGIACLATMHHVPGFENRVQMLQELEAHLAPNGRLILCNWQFLESERQRRKICDWGEIGLDSAETDPHDYLLSWNMGGRGLRYVCLIDEAESAEMIAKTNLNIVDQFRCDGKEGTLNLYTVLEHSSTSSKL